MPGTTTLYAALSALALLAAYIIRNDSRFVSNLLLLVSAVLLLALTASLIS